MAPLLSGGQRSPSSTMGSYGDVLPMRGRSRRARGVASVLASMLTRPMESLGACAAISLFVYALVRFGVGAGDVSGASGVGGPGAAVSTFVPAKIDVAKVQRSCASRTEAAGAVLVTGSAGFVGFHTALALKDRGWGVPGLDNVNDYYPTSLKRARMKELEKAGVHTVEADLNDRGVVRDALDACKFTHILHLAAQAGVRYAVKNPGSYVHSNVAGMVNIMEEIIRTSPMPKVVFASSSSVYGLNTEVPFKESDVTDSPASLYAATKKADELLAHTYNHIHGVAITALRFFTVYGPYGRPDMAYFSFANNIVRGKPITIFKGENDAELARDFTYIDDVVQGVIASLETSEASGKKPDGSKPPFRVYNLGNKHPVTVSDFVTTLEKHMGKKAKREYVPMPKTGDVPFTHADVSRAARDLGYSPRTNLDDGLKKFVDWYKEFCKGAACAGIQSYVPA